MNDVARQQIRNLLIAKVKMVIGGIRGFFSGELGVTEKQLTMDYRHLLDEGTKLKEDTEKTILDQLEKLSQESMTEIRAKIAENVNRERGYQPPMFPLLQFKHKFHASRIIYSKITSFLHNFVFCF